MMITAKHLKKTYGDKIALHIEELHIGEGESFGLVGNNGAGKTTFFRLILDLIKATEGEVLVNNTPVVCNDEWKSYVGSFLDENFLIDFLTVNEYFQFIGKLHRLTADQITAFTDSMQDFFNGEISDTKKLIRDYSKGNQKKIGIAAALIGNPKILILDEPFTALDPSSQIRLKRFLNDLQVQKNITLLVSSHDLNHITEVCKRIVILENGHIVKDIATNENTLKELEGYFAV